MGVRDREHVVALDVHIRKLGVKVDERQGNTGVAALRLSPVSASVRAPAWLDLGTEVS